ncbi:hypothetical protein PVAND_012621 [Polypedilum vanderplanki]|uniref:Uncharacterized protein n=1 Tax=Polypedilum vanderplanki TaxID=319348 RepID=A0A9J6CN93_POLVA|nr:hypothetical protein PVAND_012621 [Polypedilum vanderplanki]
MNHQDLIETASKDEWTLECDKKMLDMMQNIASKIENRATNTKNKMNAMILNLDETKVKMSNLTRINDVKNSVFCENLITDDHLEPINEVPKTNAVKLLSTQIPIENGLKLMDNCFEKHRVNFNPSESRSETSIVYRPVDKFYSSLPYLIGSDKWKEKWHLGLIEEDKVSQTGSTYAESSGSNATQNIENNLATASSLMASNDSLAKSSSSIGDQMVINKPTGLFDELYDESKETATISQPTSSFFRPQPAERKIVNLFDDEPPELDDSSYNARKPVNLFEDDYQSVASLPMNEDKVDNSQFQPPPPVDIFNENEFDDFIKRMENRNQQPSEIVDDVKEKVTAVNSGGVQRDMKLIADEIKKVQLKKKSEDVDVSENEQTKVIKPKVHEQMIAQSVKVLPEVKKVEPKEMKNTTPQPFMPVTQQKSSSQPQQQSIPKSRPKIANLFDDDEDDEDFFDEIMKQKSSDSSQSKPTQSEQPITKSIPEKKKITNLFDDEDEDDAFDDIFNKKSVNFSTPKESEKKLNVEMPKEIQKKEDVQKFIYDEDKLLFDEQKSKNLIKEKQEISKTLFNDHKSEILSKKKNKIPKSLFDDEESDDVSSLLTKKKDETPKLTSKDSEITSNLISKEKNEQPQSIFETQTSTKLLNDERRKIPSNLLNDEKKERLSSLFDDEDSEVLSSSLTKNKAEHSKLFFDDHKSKISPSLAREKQEIPETNSKDHENETSSNIPTKEKPVQSNPISKDETTINLFDDQTAKKSSNLLTNEKEENPKIIPETPQQSKLSSESIQKKKQTNSEDFETSSNLITEANNLKDSKQSKISDNKNDFTSEEGYQPHTHLPINDKNTSQLAKTTENSKKKINLFDDDDDNDEDFFVNKSTKITSEANKIESESSKVENKAINNDGISNSKINEQIKTSERSNNEIMSETEKVHDKVPNTNIKNTKENKNAPFDDFNRSIPFLNDEPPDDEDTWDPEENNNFEEPESKAFRKNFNQSKSSYQMPLFDDIPPDDEEFSTSNAPPIPSFDEFDDDDDESTLRENEDLPIIAEHKINEIVEEKDLFTESIRKTLEKSDFNDQWSDFKEKIKSKTEIEAQKVEKSPKKIKIERNSQDTVSLNSSQESKISPEKNDSDKSINTGNTSNIKSKLDSFIKSQEQPNVSQNEPKKLPGKLNSSLKINVSALMPGARLPKKEESPTKIIDMNEDEKILIQSNTSSESNSTPSTKNENNTNLLNNEATKLRAKIQVKRRPSTRKGRRSIYEKTLNEHLDENEEEKQDDNDIIDELATANEAKVVEPISSNLSMNDNDKTHNKMTIHEELSNTKANMSNFFNEEPPPIEINSNAQNIVRNKIPVFYDDEDETKKMLEEQKLKAESEKKSAAAALFDDVEDDIFGEKSNIVKEVESQPKVSSQLKKTSKPLFGDDESDEEIFKPASTPKQIQQSKPAMKDTQQSKKIAQKSLFDDEEDDDDLFGTPKKKDIEQKSEKLFDSKEKQKQGSIIFATSKSSKQQQSLFGDSDEEDDDDLFSSKPKNILSKSSSAMKSSTSNVASTSTVKKTLSAVNDPLKDLLDK